MPKLAEEPAPETPAATPTPEPLLPEQEIAIQPAQGTPRQTERPKDTPVMIGWPYPAITCPPEPEPTPEIDWPNITTPEPPTYTPEPEPTEQPQEEPAPTPQPNPIEPITPTPEPTLQPTEPPATPTPEPPTEQPSSGYAECSCGARLTPEEVLPHMKAHALNEESHSYRAY